LALFVAGGHICEHKIASYLKQEKIWPFISKLRILGPPEPIPTYKSALMGHAENILRPANFRPNIANGQL